MMSDALPDWLAALLFGRPMARGLSFGSVDAVKRQKGRFVVPNTWLKTDAEISQYKGSHYVDIILPDERLLKRAVKLPKTPRRMLERAVTLDMLRRTPFTPEQTYSVLSEVRTNAGNTTLIQWIARRDDIDGLRARLAQAGLMVRRVLVDDAILADFGKEIYPAGRLWRGLNVLAILTMLGAGAWMWAEPAFKAQEARRAQEAELQQLTTEALALRQRIQAQSSEMSERTAFLNRMTRRTPFASTLRAATVMLPDEVWLTDLGFDRVRVTVRGSTAGSAAQMLLDLPRNRLLRSPQLAGPVSQTRDGRERFDIVFQTPQGQP